MNSVRSNNNPVVKILELENLSLWQRLNFFANLEKLSACFPLVESFSVQPIRSFRPKSRTGVTKARAYGIRNLITKISTRQICVRENKTILI